MKRIAMFSGGKDSTAMILNCIIRDEHIDEIVFVDTTKEFPEIYEHIDVFEEYIGRDITRLSFDFDYWFGEHIKTKGKNKGKVGYGWPDMGARWCTAHKTAESNRYLRKYGKGNVTELHGIAFDEVHRTTKNNDKRIIRYPLVEQRIIEKEALRICYMHGFNWNGLYDKMSRVSCYCCPMSRVGEFKVIYTEYPELWKKMEDMDKKSFRSFTSKHELAYYSNRFKKENVL